MGLSLQGIEQREVGVDEEDKARLRASLDRHSVYRRVAADS